MMSGCRILLVDDHTDTLSVMSRLLKSVGHDVCVAETAALAMERLTTQTFDLLLIDLGLPDQDGRELLRRARAVCTAPAIALTGFGMDGDLESCAAAGFVKHLVKPIAFDSLLAALQELRSMIPQGPGQGCGAAEARRVSIR
jgi:two-component system CheB/CheR fusion protein